MRNKRKLNKMRIFITIIFIVLILFLTFTIITKHQKNIFSFFKSKNNNISENTEITAQNEETQLSKDLESTNIIVDSESETSKIVNINEQRKKCSEITTTRGLPVLMYHFFYDEQAGETGPDNNYLEIHKFEEQIKYLADNNYYVPTWKEVEDFINGEIGLPEKSVVITVDDGDESFFRLAVPVLEKYNFYATSFLITSWYEDCINKYKSPVTDFQSHSYNMHIPGTDGKGAFLTLPYESACEDLNKSKSIIGENCIVFCYPFGHFNNTTKKTLKDCNYTLAFTVNYGRVLPGMDCYALPRIRMSKVDSLQTFISKVK